MGDVFSACCCVVADWFDCWPLPEVEDPFAADPRLVFYSRRTSGGISDRWEGPVEGGDPDGVRLGRYVSDQDLNAERSWLPSYDWTSDAPQQALADYDPQISGALEEQALTFVAVHPAEGADCWSRWTAEGPVVPGSTVYQLVYTHGADGSAAAQSFALASNPLDQDAVTWDSGSFVVLTDGTRQIQYLPSGSPVVSYSTTTGSFVNFFGGTPVGYENARGVSGWRRLADTLPPSASVYLPVAEGEEKPFPLGFPQDVSIADVWHVHYTRVAPMPAPVVWRVSSVYPAVLMQRTESVTDAVVTTETVLVEEQVNVATCDPNDPECEPVWEWRQVSVTSRPLRGARIRQAAAVGSLGDTGSLCIASPRNTLNVAEIHDVHTAGYSGEVVNEQILLAERHGVYVYDLSLTKTNAAVLYDKYSAAPTEFESLPDIVYESFEINSQGVLAGARTTISDRERVTFPAAHVPTLAVNNSQRVVYSLPGGKHSLFSEGTKIVTLIPKAGGGYTFDPEPQYPTLPASYDGIAFVRAFHGSSGNAAVVAMIWTPKGTDPDPLVADHPGYDFFFLDSSGEITGVVRWRQRVDAVFASDRWVYVYNTQVHPTTGPCIRISRDGTRAKLIDYTRSDVTAYSGDGVTELTTTKASMIPIRTSVETQRTAVPLTAHDAAHMPPAEVDWAAEDGDEYAAWLAANP